jgi:hypothetical protein
MIILTIISTIIYNTTIIPNRFTQKLISDRVHKIGKNLPEQVSFQTVYQRTLFTILAGEKPHIL